MVRKFTALILLLCMFSGCAAPAKKEKKRPDTGPEKVERETTAADYEEHKKGLQESTALFEKFEIENAAPGSAMPPMKVLNREERKRREAARVANEFRLSDMIKAEKEVLVTGYRQEELAVWLQDLDEIRALAKREGWENTHYYESRLEEHAKALCPDEGPSAEELYNEEPRD